MKKQKIILYICLLAVCLLANFHNATATSPKDISVCNITVNDHNIVFTGKPLQPAVTITDGEVVLTEGKDYTLEYANNINIPPLGSADSPQVIIFGTGDYTGTAIKNFTIKAPTMTATPPEWRKYYSLDTTGTPITDNYVIPLPEKRGATTMSAISTNEEIVSSVNITNDGLLSYTVHTEKTGYADIKIDAEMQNYQSGPWFQIHVEVAAPSADQGTTFVTGNGSSKAKYLFLDTEEKSRGVIYIEPTNRNRKKITVPNKISIDGTKYLIVQIKAKAFQKCKKMKTLEIKATKLKDKANAVRLPHKTVVRIPKKQKKSYRKIAKALKRQKHTVRYV